MKRAVILMNLGSPDSTQVKDVSKYLDEFLMDERVIDKPWLLRSLLVKGIIVPFRSPKSAKAYESIWTEQGSPLVVISREAGQALQEKVPEAIAIAMRYGNPSVREAFDRLHAENPDLEEVLAVPMYPHYAMSSFETAVEHAKDHHQKGKYPFRLFFVPPFYKASEYIYAMAENLRPHLEKEYDQVLFSYHGIPERHVKKSDPTGRHCLQVENCCSVDSPAHDTCYRHQCLVTTRLLADMLGIPEEKRGFSFQSRLGRDPWLKPYTAVRLQELPGEGVKKLVVICPAFVSDCLETLEEMGVEGREIFMHAGGESFSLVPCLNTHPEWITVLEKWVRKFGEGEKDIIL